MLTDPLSISISSPPPGPPRPVYPQRKLLQPSPDHPDDYILELDYSSASDFMECPRRAENKMIRGREANKDNSATDFGTLFHTLEERRLGSGGITPEVVQKQHEDIATHFLSHPPPAGDHRTADRMVQVMKLYNERYANDGFPQKVLKVNGEPFVERPFKVELCTITVDKKIPYGYFTLVAGATEYGELYIRRLHIVYTGRIDAVLQEARFILVEDHKTSSRGGKQFENAFRLSLQTRMYAWAAQIILTSLLGTHTEVHGCIVNAAIIRPLTKTGVGTEFNRITYFYSQDSLFEAAQSMRAIVENFVSCLVKGYFPQHAQSFISPCDMCDFSDNCALPIAQRAADLASDLYRDVTWNPMHNG